jgi:hypothetical protein
MGYGDGKVHLLGASQLTGMTAAYVLLDVIFHSWPIVTKGDLLFYCPGTMMGSFFMHLMQNLLSSFQGENNNLGWASRAAAIHVDFLEIEFFCFP